MKIALLSDFHFGFGYGGEMEGDTFLCAEEAIEKALKIADLIAISGDIFDLGAPKTRTFANAIKIISKAILAKSSGLKVFHCDKKIPKICNRMLNSIPVVAIHGNHERKAREEINPVETLEAAGLLVYLNANTIAFEKDGEIVAIHGMSNVPERYAKSALEDWNPKPINGYNILMLHQNIDPYVYSPLEPPSLFLENLPSGFDLIVNGHVHQSVFEKIGNTNFLIPGSVSVVQLEKSEAESKKGFYLIDTKTRQIEFVPIFSARKFFFKEIKIVGEKPFREQIKNEIENFLKFGFERKPIIKLRILGKETEVIEQELRAIETEYSEKAILFLVKELESPEISEKIEFLKNLRERKMSVEEMGLILLKKNLDELNFSFDMNEEKLFRLFEEGSENAFKILLGEQSTLEKF